MKTKCSFILKACTALVLCFLMLFGTVTTSLAAVVDDMAETGGYNWKANIFFRAPDSWDLSTYSHVQAWAVQSTSASSGTKYAFLLGTMSVAGTTSNSRLYHAWIDAGHGSWGTEYIAFTANTSDWGTGDFYISTSGQYTKPLSYGATNSSGAYLFTPSNASNNTASNNNTMSGSYNGTNRDVLKKNQDFYVYTGGSSSAAGGKVDVTAYYVNGSNFSGSSAIASSDITVNSSDSGAHEQYGGAVEGTKVSMTATPSTGYKFDGYYDAATGGNLISSSASYNYYVFGTKSVYARFSLKTYTITYNKGANGTGTVASTTKTHGTNATLSSSTFTRTGYTQDGWSTTDGGAKAYDLGGSYTTNADITLYPHWSQNTYTVKKTETGGSGGTVKVGSTTIDTTGVSIAEGSYTVTVAAPTGYNVTAVSGISGTTSGLNTGSVTITGVSINAAKTIAVTYAKKTYAITLSETGGSGTMKIDGTTRSSGYAVTHGSHTFEVDAPDGYIISSISGIGTWSGTGTATATLGSTSITAPKTITVAYASAGTPSLQSIANQSKTVNDTSFNVTTTIDDADKATGTLSVSAAVKDSSTSVITVGTATKSGTTVTVPVTVKAPGTKTVTVTLKDGGTTISTQEFDVAVATPTFSLTGKTIYADSKDVAACTVTNGGTVPTSIAWTTSNSSNVAINGSTGTLTAKKINSSATIAATATYACGYTKTATGVTVNVANPTLTIKATSTSGTIGSTTTASINTASNPSSSSIKTYAWTTSDSTVVALSSASAATPTLTFKKAGTATIGLTVTYNNNNLTKTATNEVSITVSDASVSFATGTNQTINVGATYTDAATGSSVGGSASTTLTIASDNTAVATVTSAGVVTAMTPGDANITATYTVTCGGQTTTKTATYKVTVRTPTVTFADFSMAKGDSKDLSGSATTSNPSGLTIAYSVSPAVTGVTLDGTTLSVADNCSASSATIVASAKNSAGTVVATDSATLTIEAPSIDITDIDDEDVVYSTVGTNITKSISNNFNGAYSITYNDGAATSSIATASVSSGTLTITPQAKGTVTVHITATKGGVGAMIPSYLNSKLEIAATGADVTGELIGTGITATQTFTVNVAEAEDYKLILMNVGTSNTWSSAYVYYEYTGGSVGLTAMTKVGVDDNNRNVFAYKMPIAQYNTLSKIVFSEYSSWPSDTWRQSVDFTTKSNAYTVNDDYSNGNKRGVTTWTHPVKIPQVTITDVEVAVDETATSTITNVNNISIGKTSWTTDDADIATVSDGTVTGVDTGTTTLNANVWAAKPYSTWTTWTMNDTTLPVIGSTGTASVSVTADNKTLNFANKLSTDGTTYSTASASAAGTITATKKNTATTYTDGASVEHGTTVVFSASANSGYKLVGWDTNGDGTKDVSTATAEVRITANTTVYALFDKYYALTISESADHGVVTSSGEDVVWNNTPSTFTVTPAAGYMIDYANCTNLSKYYTVDTSATTGTVTFTGKTVDAGDKTTATITIAYKAILPVINYTAKKTDDGSTLVDGGGTITAKEIEYTAGTPGTGTASYYYLWWSGSDNPEQHNIKANAVKATDGSYYASFQPSGNFYFNITDSSSSATSGTQKLTSSTTGVVGEGFASWTTVGNWSSYYIGKGYLSSGDTVYIKFNPTENKVYFQNSAFTYTIAYTGGSGGTEATETEIKTLSASGDTIGYDHRVYFTATPASDYAFEGWYSDASCTTLLSTDKTYKTDDITAASYTIYAKFKKLSYITLYNSYMKDSNNNWQFVASPPRKVEIYANASASTPSRTYVYDTGGGEQRGEEYVLYDGGTYYEGNKLVVYPGEKIKLIFSTLASSDAIKGVFFNNDRRYTTESQDDNLYYLREYREGGWGSGTTEDPYVGGLTGEGESVPDDDWDYTFLSGTTIFADAGYYTDEAATISAQQANYAANKTGGAVDQSAHTVEWVAEGSYLNVDIQLDYKYQVHINNDDWSGLKIENMNDEGYYYHGEDFTKTVSGSTAQFKISLEQPTDGTGTYSWTDTDAILSLNSNPSTPEAPSGVAVTAKKSDGTTASSVSEISYFIVEGEMPNSALYITLPISKTYNLKLANIVVSDGSTDAPTMLTETNGGTTSSTGNIGTITALDKASSSDAGTSVVASGNWYTYRANNGNPAIGNDHVSVYNNNDYNNNRYLAGGVNRDGALVEDGHTVTYTFNFASGKEAEYTFVGWFEGTYNDGIFTVDYNKKLSGKQTFTYTPKKDTVVIAVGTRDIYIGGNFTSTGSYTSTSSSQTWASGRILMEFDPTYEKTVDGTTYKGRYYYTFDSVLANTEYKFRCYDTVSGSEFANLSVWNAHLSDIHGYYNDDNDIFDYRSKYDAGSGNWTTHGGFMFTNRTDKTVRVEYDSTDYGTTGDKSVSKNHTANGYGNPVNVYFYAYDSGISVDSTYQWSKAYVSAGVGIDVQSVSGDTTTYNTPSVSVANTTVAGGTVDGTTSTENYGQEKIYECTVKEANGQIQVTANPNDDNLCVQAFLIYNIDTKASEAVMVNSEEATGAITANITVPQNSNIYIVPIYKFTQAWIDSQNALADESQHVESHTVYVRASDIDKDDWGGLVSMYSWGTTKGYDSGGWPGQLMIPSDDGQSFYAPLTYLHNGLAGVTFNNYTKIWGGNFVNFLGLYQSRGVSDTVYSSYTNTSKHYINQAYDYREPISIIDNINDGGIYDSDDMDLTFALKPGNKNGSNHGASTYSDSYDFEYLTDRSGKKRVDLNGNVLSTSATATYYVVCKYTRDYVTGKDYDFKDGSRDGSSTHNAFSIEWAVYDQTHTKIGSEKLSAAYTDVYKSEMLTYVAKMLDSYGYPVSGKAVKIAYEDPAEGLLNSSNETTEAKRFSGQWYADGVNSLIEGNVRVGIYADGAWLPSDTNAPGYATATVGVKSGSLVTIPNATTGEQYVTEDGCTGNSLVKVTKTHATNGNITFSVNTIDNFLGWYRDDGEGGFEPIGSNYKSQTITPSFGFDTTYYAFYSASATYRFKYNDRFGNAKYYTAKGTGLTGDEMTAGGTLDAATRASDITSKLAGVSGIKVFNNTTSYVLGTPDTSSPYTITYTANQTVDSHTLTVMAYKADGTAYEKKTTVSGTWATPVNLDKSYVSIKPDGHSDYEFIGWKKYNTEEGETEGDILSTQANFGYSVVEEMTIAPVFGPSKITDETWAVGIDKNGTTQELTSEGKGTMYNDSLISFRYKKETGQQLDLTSGKECGIVILAQTAEARTDSTQADAFDAAVPSSYLTALKANNRTVAKMRSATYGEAYAYYVTASSLSRLNRADLFQAFDYEKFNGGQFRVMSYYYNGSTYEYSELVYGDLVAR